MKNKPFSKKSHCNQFRDDFLKNLYLNMDPHKKSPLNQFYEDFFQEEVGKKWKMIKKRPN